MRTTIHPTFPSQVETIDQATYESYRLDLDNFESWRNGRTSYHPNEVPPELSHVNNDMRGKVEQYEFRHKLQASYFAYWSKRQVANDGSYQIAITTWNGEILGKAHTGKRYRDNFGGTRVSFTMLGINGLWYSGTYYESSGDYVRFKLLKRNPNTGVLQTSAA